MFPTQIQVVGSTVGAAEVYNTPAGGAQIQTMTPQGHQRIDQVLPERTELVRLGNSWGAQMKEGNAFTVLITIPSTLAGLSLQNGEAANGGKSYIIDRCWFKCVTTTAAANYLTMLAQVVVPGTALVADSANKTVQSLSAKAINYNGKAQIALASVVTGCLADKWTPIGNSVNAATSTSIAAFGEAFVYGRYVIPPQGSFNLNLQEAVSGGTAILGVEWHEVALTLG